MRRRRQGRCHPVWLAALSAVLCLSAAPALAHQDDVSFRSEVESLRPAVRGLEARVLNQDTLELTNRTGDTVVVEGYNGEPYLRMRGDGTVQLNSRSSAAYLNEDRYGETPVPAAADDDAPPKWIRIADGGNIAWYDHRIHWMSRRLPARVKNEHAGTHIRDWRVPLSVGGRAGSITGSLDWRPPRIARRSRCRSPRACSRCSSSARSWSRGDEKPSSLTGDHLGRVSPNGR